MQRHGHCFLNTGHLRWLPGKHIQPHICWLFEKPAIRQRHTEPLSLQTRSMGSPGCRGCTEGRDGICTWATFPGHSGSVPVTQRIAGRTLRPVCLFNCLCRCLQTALLCVPRLTPPVVMAGCSAAQMAVSVFSTLLGCANAMPAAATILTAQGFYALT